MTTIPSSGGSTREPKVRLQSTRRGEFGESAQSAELADAPVGSGAWIVLPTYNEVDNLASIAAAILAAVPGATLLVVDDESPDGTGTLADELAASEPRIRVRRRPAKQGLGRAYLDGFGIALADGARYVVQMDADWSHDPATLGDLLRPVRDGAADLVIGSRYTRGGGVVDWGFGRRVISRGGSVFARLVLGLAVHDLTGGFKAWRAATLASIPFAGVHAGGYVFQIEMTFRASRSGARVAEVPITFRDRRVGQSKMSRRIVFEALLVVVQLRAEELMGRVRGSRRAIAEVPASAVAPDEPDHSGLAHGAAERAPATVVTPTDTGGPAPEPATSGPPVEPDSVGR
jgi:dolichol-phosphate mannosyltransferase